MGRQIRSRQIARALPVLLPALLGAGTEAPSQSPGTPLETPGRGLIRALGSENWDERESAQLRLLEEGLSVAPLLEQAMRSENLELAYRARYLLARIDPRITAFQVIRVGTGPRVEVIDAAVAVGMEGEELSARPIAGDNGGAYTIQFRTEGARSADGDSDDGARLPGVTGRLELWIARARQGSPGPEARCEIAAPATIALVHRGEECLYTRMGLEIARERRPYITIVRVKTGRRSLLEKEPLSSGKESIFEEVLRDLDAQSLVPDPEARSAAIEILGEMDRYRGPLEEHLADPDTRDAAAYASGKPELLEDLVRKASRDEEDVPPGRGAVLAIRSAARLASRGSPEAAGLLLEKLLDPEPPHPHLVLASLADAVREGKLARETRLDVQRRALGDETLTRVPWDDVESEYFFSALLAPLDPEVEEERGLAREFLSSLERLARGELGPVAVRLRTIIELWRRAARKAPGPDAVESRMLIGVLPHLNGAASFSEAAVILEDALVRGAARGEADAELLPAFLAILGGNIAEGDPGIVNVSFQSLLRLSRAFPVGRGQLAPLAGALIGACEAASRDPGAPPRGTQRFISPAAHLLRQAEEILAGWTGIPASPGQPGLRKPDTSGWRSWLDDAARVEAREAELLAARSVNAEAPASRFVYYEFDLATGDPKKGLARARVLDARRLDVRLSQPILYRDRWGNEMQLRIDAEPRTEANPTRFRVSSRPMLFGGLPALVSVQGRDLSASWHDSSDLGTSSTPISRADPPGFRSLVLLLPADEDAGAPAGAAPEELWSWFLEHRLLALPENATPQRIQSVINVVRALEPPQAAPLVRRLFDKAPTADYAKLLHELGDESGVPFLLAELAKGDEPRVRASINLLELGRAEGFAGLLGPDAPRQAIRKMFQTVGPALDDYLKHPRATPEGKQKALRFLFEWLDDTTYQPKAFSVIQLETGLDFGYSSARGIDDQDRRAAALEACVRAARAWWQARGAAR